MFEHFLPPGTVIRLDDDDETPDAGPPAAGPPAMPSSSSTAQEPSLWDEWHADATAAERWGSFSRRDHHGGIAGTTL
eukprot:8624925-Heterocapsa_arctica.AAC.1